MARIEDARAQFQRDLCSQILGRTSRRAPISNADGHSPTSRRVGGILGDMLESRSLPLTRNPVRQPQTVGDIFTKATADFLVRAFKDGTARFRPGEWRILRTETVISQGDQYTHLDELLKIENENQEEIEFLAAISGDYLVTPDVLILRAPISEARVTRGRLLARNSDVARLTALRASNQVAGGTGTGPPPSVHASVSCKWTIRSDRAQNIRTEGLNLAKNRKGSMPHMAVVTAEPLPSRIESVARGTGEIDCVYHAALYELEDAVEEGVAAVQGRRGVAPQTVTAMKEQRRTLQVLIQGKRLRDISDLAFDLAV